MAPMPPMDDALKALARAKSQFAGLRFFPYPSWALHWRAWHRGTREADLMIGGFFDAHREQWGQEERDWFAGLLAEQDVDIMAWAVGTTQPPERFQGPMMEAMQRLDYLKAPR